jgi:hypothetical protein
MKNVSELQFSRVPAEFAIFILVLIQVLTLYWKWFIDCIIVRHVRTVKECRGIHQTALTAETKTGSCISSNITAFYVSRAILIPCLRGTHKMEENTCWYHIQLNKIMRAFFVISIRNAQKKVPRTQEHSQLQRKKKDLTFEEMIVILWCFVHQNFHYRLAKVFFLLP